MKADIESKSDEESLNLLLDRIKSNKLTSTDLLYLQDANELISFISRRKHLDANKKLDKNDLITFFDELVYIDYHKGKLGLSDKIKETNLQIVLPYVIVLLAVWTHQLEVIDTVLIHELAKQIIANETINRETVEQILGIVQCMVPNRKK